ncbi:MAG: cupin domain-containing protein [Actinomycetota bacterium]|nr:cupin domain-containing protein [Actinomycetota bacterium]
MLALPFEELELNDAWIEGDDTARWRSAGGHSPSEGSQDSGSSVLEVDPGHRLPRHTDSGEETIVVVAGTAEVEVAGETARLGPGGQALVPTDVPHQVHNVGSDTLRFIAVYASPDIVTTYEQPVQPDGSRERHTVS